MTELNEVADILAVRGKTHGPWDAQAYAAQEIKNAIHRWDTKGLPGPQIEALEMIAVKISRILQGNANEPDHWNDIAGYSALGRDFKSRVATKGVIE